MLYFLQQLKSRNEILFYFGSFCWLMAAACLVLAQYYPTQVHKVNAWIKPFKFAASIALYAFTMAWFVAYLPKFNVQLFNWSIVVLLGFEWVYIAIQAGRGQLSHFNISTPTYALLYGLMAAAATLVALYTAYIGWLFFTNEFTTLPNYYVWAIRLGIVLFVVFSFEGFVMGARLSHTIGGADGGPGIPILHWSTRFGDPRVAHFIGMHALQILPLVSYYVLRNTKATWVLATVYAFLALFTLIRALQGKPLLAQPTLYKHTPKT